MYACIKFVSTRSLVRSTSQLRRSLSAVVLKLSETLTDESLSSVAPPRPLTSLISSHLGFALSEALELFCLMVAFLILFAM